MVAGVLSALVFERRRARQPIGHDGPARSRGTHYPERPKSTRRGRAATGWGRAVGPTCWARLATVAARAETVRALEEVHVVPRTRQPEPGLATAVTAWARGASLATALGVAARDVGEMAPGDFVRTVKQLADLAGQVAQAAPDPATAAAADAAVGLLVRDVVAAGGHLPASANRPGPES